jgi:heptosyltransferase I
MTLPLTTTPKSLCLLRLSAVGDISHTLPLLRTLQQQWPETKITWIIGKTEYGLVSDIPGIEFIVFDKSQGWQAHREIRRHLRGRRFDVLLHMQTSLRASLISLAIKSPIKLGFDRQRAKDLQWLFTNHKIAHQPQQHVIESFLGFAEALGIHEHILAWEIPIPEQASHFAAQQIPDGQPTLVISPCSSMAYRNWNAEGYAAIADYATRKHNMHVILSGGPSAIEREYGDKICQLAQHTPVNLIGHTSLKQLLAILQRATVVISPDAGPAHLATAVATPVIGLYACTNPDRARPYLSPEYVVNRYPEAVQDKFGKPVTELPWGMRVRDEGTMNRITVEDVSVMMDRVVMSS